MSKQAEQLIDSFDCPEKIQGSDLQIKPLGGHLIQQVCELEQICYASPWSSSIIEKEFHRDISYRFGLFSAEQLVGYNFNYLLQHELHILNIAVHPELRSQGIGRYFLSEVLIQAASKGVSHATLEVRVSNSGAQLLYAKLGFRTVGSRKRYYRNNGEDALILDLALTPQRVQLLKENSLFTPKSHGLVGLTKR